MASQEPLQALHRMGEALVALRDDVAQSRTSQAVVAEKLTRIEEYLRTLNGRVAKAEDRLSGLDNIVAEARGAWKFIALVSAIPAGLISAAAVWISQHTGGK